MGAMFAVPVARGREHRASCPARARRARRRTGGEPLRGSTGDGDAASSAPSARGCRTDVVAACDEVAHIPIARATR